jgi:MFS family permease
VNVVSMIALPTPSRRPGPLLRMTRLSPTAAFVLQVSIVLSLLAGSSAPTPLYAVYQAAWGFSPVTVTVVFGVYAVAVLTALLTVGSLSDHVGRRPVLLVALLLQAATMLGFASAHGVADLVLARIVQGLSTGAAVSALGAGLLDLHRARGTLANAVAPMMGTASGALASGLLVQYLPAPTHLVYLLMLGIFAAQAVGVVLMPETATRKAGALASLRPRFALPATARRPMLLAVPALVAIWALVGFYASLGPALVRLVAESSSFVLGGLSLFILGTSGAVTVVLIQKAQPGTVMRLGIATLIVGVATTELATVWMSLPALFLGTAVAGIGFGASFQGILRTVLPAIAPPDRAGVLAILYAVSYLALGLPAVIGGVLAVHGGILTAGQEYGLAVMLLGALALLGLLRSDQPADASRRLALPCPQVSPLAGRP